MFRSDFGHRHVIKKYSDLTEECSEIVENSGVKWLLQTKKDKTNLQVDVICLNDAKKDETWWIKAALNLQMPSSSSVLKCEPATSKRVVFNKEKSSFTFKFIAEDVAKEHEGDKEVILECQLEIQDVRGVALKRKMTGDVPEEGKEPSVTLTVGEKEIEVSRMVLAWRSDFFQKLLFGNASNKKKTKFALDSDVNPTDFENLMAVFNGKRIITADNINGILKLAKKYEMQNVKDECELFLRNDTGIDKKKRFKLVDEFGFEELKKEMLDSMKSLKDIQEVMTSSMENLDESTIRAIAEKLVNEAF